MKKIFTSLATIVFMNMSFGQIITQNTTPNVVSASGSVACANTGAGITKDNAYYRAFKLSDYGIAYDYKVTNVAFGVASANMTFPVEVGLYNVAGTFPSGALTLLGSANVNVSPTNNGGMANTGTSLNQIISAGSTFVVKIFHDGTTGFQAFYLGTNSGAQTGPSYFSSVECGVPNPIATGTGVLAGSPNAKWVMTVTGQNNTLGTTEVINSRDLQVYPNPVKDILKFKFSNNLKSESIEIYDLSGKIITSINNNKNVNEVNMSDYVKGNYVLRVKANDGRIYIQKIIKD